MLASIGTWKRIGNSLKSAVVSFESVVSAIDLGGLVDVLDHPNQVRYPGQMIYVVNIEQYLYLVPFATATDGTRFLKTIIPSRKAMRDYRRRPSS